jgi:hydrogenase nickel incorporation protein HypA/HybF
MHELSIAKNIIEIVEENITANDNCLVESVEIEVGKMSGVVKDALDFAMEELKINSVLQHTKFNYIEVETLFKCNSCLKTFNSNSNFDPCPECGYPFMDIIEGKDLIVRKIILTNNK